MTSATAYSTIAVIGGTGTLGSHITTALIKKGFRVKIFTREDRDSKTVGAEFIVVDYKDKKCLISALKDVEVVICTLSGKALFDQLLLIDACKDAGVKRFYPSEFVGDPTLDEIVIYREVKMRVFKALQNSGLEWTFFICGLFMEFIDHPFLGLDFKNNIATLVGTENSLLTLTSLKNVGEFVAESINNPISKNAYICVEGETVTYSEMVKIIEKVSLKNWYVTYKNTEKLEFVINGNPNKWETLMEQFAVCFGNSGGAVSNAQNEEFPKVKPESLSDFLKRSKFK